MTVVTAGGLKPPTNAQIMNAVRNDASLEYRNRIPVATQANIADTVATLYRYKPQWNEFINALVNRIGETIVRNIVWNNPLAEFKGGMLEFGDTIEEIQIGLIEAKVYDPDREYLERDIFGTVRPMVDSNFHTVNRQNYYPISINEALLKRAFLESGGLHSFVAQLLQAPATSDQVDEFKLMVSLFAEYERNGGFFHVNIPDVANRESDGADARAALREIRAMSGNLPFVSTAYNAAKMPVAANPEELVLFATPEFIAAIDVEALAGAFNIDKAQIPNRVIAVPASDFGIPGAQAVLTTKDFFVVRDQLLENTSMQNPVGLTTNYFLHHWQVISCSRFVPAILFHTGADDRVERISQAPTAISAITAVGQDGTTALASGGNALRGAVYQLDATVTTLPAGGPQAFRFRVTGAESTRTFVSETGVLHVGWDESSALVTVEAITTGFNDDNLRDDAKVSAKFTFVPTGAITPPWPNVGTVDAVNVLGARIPVATGTNAYTITSTADSFTKEDRDAVVVESSGPLSVVSVKSAGKVLTIIVDPSYGAATRTLTFTLTPPA